MNMIRGAVAFLLIIVVCALAQCKKQSDTEPSSTGGRPATAQQKGGQPGTVPSSTCADATTDMQFCGDPAADCVVWLNVSTSTTVTAPDKVWIDSGQKVVWRGMETNDTGKRVKVKRVHFAATDSANDKTPKKGDKLISEADCQNNDECVKQGKEFTPCVAYGYTAILIHNGKAKRSDPEIEVGSTTGILDTTGTSGTTSTSGTH